MESLVLVAVLAAVILNALYRIVRWVAKRGALPAGLGLLRGVRGRRIAGDGAFDFDIVGEASYQDALARAAGGRPADGARVVVSGYLIPEPDNPHDRSAIRAAHDGRTLGYIARSDTAAVHGILRGKPAQVRILIVGGWDRGNGDSGHYGARLDVAWPPALARA